MQRYVYLAGNIAECTDGEANDWRAEATERLDDHEQYNGSRIIGVSPLRCEPAGKGGKYPGPLDLNNADPKFGTARAISSKNRLDVQKSDLVLAYLPRELNERRPSYGTVIEIAWAHWEGKPVVLVTDDPYLREHPLVQVCSSWIVETFEEAYEIIFGVLDVYAGV